MIAHFGPPECDVRDVLIARLRDELEAAQARIDELMLEYCPDEMTPEQVAKWAKHQRRVEE
jgi:hypothetical protein